MEDYVTIYGKDAERIRTTSDGQIPIVKYNELNGRLTPVFDIADGIDIPKSLLYLKVPMTEAEKAELDKLKNEMSAHIYDLDDLLTRIKDSEDFPFLYHRLYVADGNGVESQLEFARAWADPSLIEVIPEKRWNVRVPISCGADYYYKYDGHVEAHINTSEDELLYDEMQFTAEEIKYYHLDNDLFEKVEVTDDGTK